MFYESTYYKSDTHLCEVLFNISVGLREQFSAAMLLCECCDADGVGGVQLPLEERTACLYNVYNLS